MTDERLRKRIANQDAEIETLRHLVAILWKCGRTEWRINGDGKQRHLNDGRGTSFGAVEDNDGNVLITSARLCKAAERSLNRV